MKYGADSPLSFHLREAQEHLIRLREELEQFEFDDDSLAVEIAHLYHHVNSAWNSRKYQSIDDLELIKKFEELAQFPTDLKIWE